MKNDLKSRGYDDLCSFEDIYDEFFCKTKIYVLSSDLCVCLFAL